MESRHSPKAPTPSHDRSALHPTSGTQAKTNMPFRTLRLTIEYDGTAYHGWQRQEGVPTVQGVVEQALKAVLGHDVQVEGSGRTDRGVHAWGLVASLHTTARIPVARLPLACNTKLPPDVAVRHAEEVEEAFHPRFDAVSKVYRYTLAHAPTRSPRLARIAHHDPRPLDVASMHAAAQLLVGTHDFYSFATFAKLKESTVRTIFWFDVRRRSATQPEVVELTVCGDGFLYNQVRTMAGTLHEVGLGSRTLGQVQALLATRDRRRAGMNLPPQGLCLLGVQYRPETPTTALATYLDGSQE